MNREGPGKIGYLDFVWNPVVGCTNGCSYCWARRQAKRQKHNCPKCYAFTPHLHPERLDEPLRKREPLVIGVAFMGDLFDPAFVLNPIFRWTGKFAPEAVLEIMDEADWHTFVLLTKQPQLAKRFAFPPNVVLGVSPTDQESADRLVPELMECRAARRIVSIEPMRGPVDLCYCLPSADGFVATDEGPCHVDDGAFQIDGVILGGQTGPGTVPLHPDWVRKVRDQCAGAGVPFFFKQWGDVVYPEAMTDEVFAEIDAAVNLSGCRQGAFRVGRKRAGRVLDGRTHDELAWDKNFTLSVKA